MATSDIVVSYHDSILRQADIQILKGNGWLTDSIIGFYLQYVEKEVYQNKPLLFVSPEVTQCLKSCQSSDLKIFLDPLSPKKYSLVFFPLNNNEDTNSAGGWHWSLLTYYKLEDVYYHFDSSSGANGKQAHNLTNKLCNYFNTSSNYGEHPTLQQNNSYDCGIHLLCNVENIANHWIRHKTLNSLPLVDIHNVKEKRSDILKIAHSKAKHYAK